MSTTRSIVSERERAKRILAGIIREAGGVVTSKTELIRLFWRAHLVYAESQAGYLSFWPLLKTSSGPAIQALDPLLGELVAEGTLRISDTAGAGAGLRLELIEDGAATEILPPDAVEAIQQSVASSDEPPDLRAYARLRSWNEAADGEELNIYLDVIPEAEYAERKQRMQEMASVLNDVWQ